MPVDARRDLELGGDQPLKGSTLPLLSFAVAHAGGGRRNPAVDSLPSMKELPQEHERVPAQRIEEVRIEARRDDVLLRAVAAPPEGFSGPLGRAM